MKSFFKFTCILLSAHIAVVFTGCANGYKQLSKFNYTYDGVTNNELPLKIEIARGAFSKSGNRRYDIRSNKSNTDMLAIKITNTSNESITLPEDGFQAYMGGGRINELSPDELKNVTKGAPGLFMIWSLLWVVIYSSSSDGASSVIPIPVGAFIGLGNMLAAQSANNNLYVSYQLSRYKSMQLEPGGSVVFFHAYQGAGIRSSADLSFEISDGGERLGYYSNQGKK